jgi:1-phosphofructokinase family hexose kinase
LSPAWDITCRGKDLDWGRHPEIDEQVVRPAGKALNVSYALAWMGLDSLAAGLWGREDYDEMQTAVARRGGLIEPQMTTVAGQTRRNITVVDTVNRREMHLRCRSSLASRHGLSLLNTDLSRLTRDGDTCVFAGSMPAGSLLEQTVDLVRTCHGDRIRSAVDTHGPALHSLVEAGLPWLIAPNVEELRGLLHSEIEDTPTALVEAGRTLLDRVGMVLISRGANGAVVVTAEGTWAGQARRQGNVLSTVGCGDYLLAGFLAGFRETADPSSALARGLKIATARAWGWTETAGCSEVEEGIAIKIESVAG